MKEKILIFWPCGCQGERKGKKMELQVKCFTHGHGVVTMILARGFVLGYTKEAMEKDIKKLGKGHEVKI